MEIDTGPKKEQKSPPLEASKFWLNGQLHAPGKSLIEEKAACQDGCRKMAILKVVYWVETATGSIGSKENYLLDSVEVRLL